MMIDQVNAVGSERPWLVFVSTRAPFPPVTGHFIRSYNIIRQIAAYYRVALFAFYDKNLSAEQERGVESALSAVCEHVCLKRLHSEESLFATGRLILGSVMRSKPLVAYKYFDPAMASALSNFIADHDVALVHLDMLPLVEYLDVVGDLPVLLTQHNIESDRLRRIAASREGLFSRWYLKDQSRKLDRYERISLKSINHCCVVSENDRRAVLSMNEHCNVHLVPNGVDIGKFVPGSPAAHTAGNLLWVGGMNDEYNKEAVLHFAKHILPKIVSVNPDVTWTVIGKSPPPDLVDLSRKYNIELAGMVDDLIPYYHRAAVVVVPLLSGAGTKLKVIEAMAMGKATVGTPIAAEGIADKDDDFLCVADSDQEFANQVVELLGNESQRARVGELARAEVLARFDWDTIGRAQIEANNAVRGDTKCVE